MIPHMPRRARTSAPPRALGRRAVVAGVLGLGLTGSLSGCRVRVDVGQGLASGSPTRAPVAGEAALLALLDDTRGLATSLRTWPSPLAAPLAAVHTAQAQVLAALLERANVPVPEPTASSPSSSAPITSSTSATRTPLPSPTLTTTAVAAAEAGALAGAANLAMVPPDLAPAVCSVLAQRMAAAWILGGTWPALTPLSTGTWDSGALGEVLAATGGAAYGFDVVAAQGDPATRARAIAAARRLRALEAEQAAAGTVPTAPAVGYVLPFRVTTPALALRLAGVLVTGLENGYGAALPAATAPVAFGDLVRWLAYAVELAHEWGAPISPFPGMVR